ESSRSPAVPAGRPVLPYEHMGGGAPDGLQDTGLRGSPLDKDRSAHDLPERARDADEKLPILVQTHDAAWLPLLGEKPVPLKKTVLEKGPADRLEAAAEKEREPLLKGREHLPEHLPPAQIPPEHQGQGGGRRFELGRKPALVYVEADADGRDAT